MRSLATISLIVLGLIACSSQATGASTGTGSGTGTSSVCTPGASVACTCTDGQIGAQVCQANGAALGPCVCQSSSTSSGSGSSSTTGGSSSGGAVSTSGGIGSGSGSSGSSGTADGGWPSCGTGASGACTRTNFCCSLICTNGACGCSPGLGLGDCNASSDCCNGLPCNHGIQGLKYGTCGFATEDPCDDDAGLTCVVGDLCVNGTCCVGDNVLLGAACANSNDCCSGICDGGTCAPIPIQGACPSPDYSVDQCAGSLYAVCFGGRCCWTGLVGGACSSGADCCSGYCLAPGECQAAKPAGVACTQQTAFQCESNICTDAGVCAGGCASNGSAPPSFPWLAPFGDDTPASGCCSGYADGGLCACIPSGLGCGNSVYCCSGACSAGLCQ